MLCVTVCIDILWLACAYRNMQIAESASLRKTAMSLMSLNPADLRPLTLPERKCLSEIISHYLLGDAADESEQPKALTFGERSLSRLASFSMQSGQRQTGTDVFASVDMVARGINWFLIRRNHKKRLAAQSSSSLSAEAERGGHAAEADYVPPDTPALRSLLELRDVELCHYTMGLAKTVVKRALWEAHMSDRSGWVDSFYWHPINLTDRAAADVAQLSVHGVSFRDVHSTYSAEEERRTGLERSASMIADREADMLDRSDLAAANMVETSSESEDEDPGDSPEVVTKEQSKQALRALGSVIL